ncbi:MAG: rod-binding protein [bacterium]|nr:rod-binding protein [bacterium]
MSAISPISPSLLAGPTITAATGSVDFATNPDRAKAAAEELEGVFASMLIQTMRKSVGDEGLFAGDSSDVLGGMFDLHMGRAVSKSGGLGVAQMIEKYTQAQATE